MEKNHIFKYGEDLDRYEYIADYFTQNPDRLTKKNRNYLEDISESLRKDLFQDAATFFDFSIKKVRKKLEDTLSGKYTKVEAQN